MSAKITLVALLAANLYAAPTDTCVSDTAYAVQADTARYQVIRTSTIRTITACQPVSRTDTTVSRDTVRDSSQATASSTGGGDLREPVGFTPIMNVDFSSKIMGPGWVYRTDWNGNWGNGVARAEIVNDGTAPFSSHTFLRFNWPAGGEQSPTKAERPFGAAYREIYLSLWFRHSPGFQNNPTGTNKIFYIGTNNSATYDGEIFFDFHGAAEVRFRNQQPEPDAPARPPNVNLNPCKPGQWYRLEAVLQQSTGGQANGRVQWWIDGALQGDYSNVLYAASGNSLFDAINLDPIWGGGGATPRAMWLDFDHLYISGMP